MKVRVFVAINPDKCLAWLPEKGIKICPYKEVVSEDLCRDTILVGQTVVKIISSHAPNRTEDL